MTIKGGKRAGSGRKPAPPNLKKVQVSVKLPRWLRDWLSAQEKSRGVLIEEALREKHRLTPPAAEG